MEHPVLWKFIDSIRAIQNKQDLIYVQMLRGDEPLVKRRKYLVVDVRIRRIVDNYDGEEILEYLKAIALNFSME